MDLKYALVGSGVGWLIAFTLCHVFHWLRLVAAKPVATLGNGVACLWLIVGAVAFLVVLTDSVEREYGNVPSAALKTALLFLTPTLLCAGIAWLHRGFHPVPADTQFGILAAEAALVALLLFPHGAIACLFDDIFGYGFGGAADQVYHSTWVALLLSLIVEEIAGPLRRRGGGTVS